MADIAGIGSGADTFVTDAQRRAREEEQLQESTARRGTEQQPLDARDSSRSEEAAQSRENAASPPVAETGTDQNASEDRAAQAIEEDTVSLSENAQGALQAAAANEDRAASVVEATPAAGEVNAVAGDTRETNQVARQEDTTSEVNGNQNNQPEANRTLGQVVDQFA